MSNSGWTLRLLTGDDLADLAVHLARHRAESGRAGDVLFMPFRPAGSAGPTLPQPNDLLRDLDQLLWQRWFGMFNADGRLIGHVDLKGPSLAAGRHRCMLGIGLERPYRRLGLGRELMQTAIDFARQAPQIDWIDLHVFGHNHPARRLYESFGFQEVGRITDRFRIDGESIDDLTMTLPTTMSVAEGSGVMEQAEHVASSQCVDPDVWVAECPLGQGVFASRPFPANTFVGEIVGEQVKGSHYGSDYAIDLEDGTTLEPSPPFRYLNHSCDPNCELVFLTADGEIVEDSARPRIEGEPRDSVQLFTLRDIAEGEQLSIDYHWPAEVAIPCRCGADNCRGWIVAPEELDKLPR